MTNAGSNITEDTSTFGKANHDALMKSNSPNDAKRRSQKVRITWDIFPSPPVLEGDTTFDLTLYGNTKDLGFALSHCATANFAGFDLTREATRE
jgi:hypothetical protein